MRFGKKNKNSLAMGWRAKSQPACSEFGLVASEERNALLYSPPTSDDDYDVPQDSGISPAKRQLASVLGRFERHMARAREGAPQEVWSDECMNQLIRAVEIAVAEGWPEVVEALTETGRILQSYENEGQAHLSVRFLTESNEILSQMVSDLMLGKARSGLMQKWRNRYRMALQDLKEAGILLVRDEDDPYAAARIAERAEGRERRTFDRAPRPEPESVSRSAPFEMPAEDAAPAFSSASPFEMPLIDDYLHEEVEESPTGEAAMDAESGVEEPWTDTSSVAGWENDSDTEEETPDFFGELEPLAPLGGGNLLELGAEVEEEEAPECGEESLPSAGSTAPEVIDRLDVLCERLSHMEREPESDIEEGFQVILDSVGFLEEQAGFYRRPGCVELCGAMTRLCGAAAERATLPEDKFFELAYAFCGVYVEADESPDNAMIRGWIGECEVLLAEWALSTDTPEDEPQAAVEEEEEEMVAEEPAFEAPEAEELFFDTPIEAEPEAAAPFEESEAYLGADSPEAMLHVAQRAMTEGNASEAKQLALRAASMLAQMEVDEATGRVNLAERRLQEGAELIDSARGDVQRAELVVSDTARSVAEGQKVLDTRHAEVAGTAQKLSDVEARVAELDEQIRQLEARRDEETKRLAETRGELENAQAREAETSAEVASRNEAEREARVRLEDARQRVKNLQRKRTEIETAMDRARETLTHQRVSLADIQQMLAQVGGRNAAAQAADVESGEFLF